MSKPFPYSMVLTFLVTPYKEGGFLGMCRETGIIKGGSTVEEVQSKLLAATKLIVDTVQKDSRFLPSLQCGLPIKYKLIFYWSLLQWLTHRIKHITLFTKSTASLVPQFG